MTVSRGIDNTRHIVAVQRAKVARRRTCIPPIGSYYTARKRGHDGDTKELSRGLRLHLLDRRDREHGSLHGKALKTNIGVFIDQLTAGQTPIRDWRGKAIGYRDVKSDGKSWYKDNPFVQNDAVALKAQLGSAVPEGGGDEPQTCSSTRFTWSPTWNRRQPVRQSRIPGKWRFRREATRVVIVFTDATYHREMSVSGGKAGASRMSRIRSWPRRSL